MADPILSARGVHVRFDTPTGQVHAVRGVDIDLYPGETLAIVGESGAGKSAFAKAILHLHQLPFTPNRTRIDGHIALHAPFEAELTKAEPVTIRRARAQAVGMIFQDALSALNPVHPIGRQIAEAVRLSDASLHPKTVETQVTDIVEAIGLPKPERAIHAFPHQLSGGQCQRVMIAIAAVRHPVALIADEPTTALDVTVQAQILHLLKSLQTIRGMAMLFISHDLGVVAEIADRVAVMLAGEVVELGRCADVLEAPQHAYTRALLESRPGSTRRARAKISPLRPAVRIDGQELDGGADDAPTIVADNVSFAYPSGFFGTARSDFMLEQVSLVVRPGTVHGLVGESGSGKSTLGRVILGFLRPSSGRIETCGVAPHALSGEQHRLFRKMVQVVHQDSATTLNPRMTLGRSAAEGLYVHGASRSEAAVKVRALFDQVRLPRALMDRFPHEVSGGQRQRVCIARALATRPQVLMADEPVTALDMSVQAQILELFAELQAEFGLTMVLISHDLGVVRELCDHVAVMHQGRVVEHGPTAQILDAPATPYAQTLISSVPGRTLSRVRDPSR